MPHFYAFFGAIEPDCETKAAECHCWLVASCDPCLAATFLVTMVSPMDVPNLLDASTIRLLFLVLSARKWTPSDGMIDDVMQ